MAEEGLVVLVKSRRKYNSYQGELSPSVPNTVNRDFHSEKPNEKWLTDITEFVIPAGKVYLSPVVDCFDGMLPYWTISTKPDAALVNDMPDGAISQLGEEDHPIIHSDRGCHYRWPGWISRMEKAGLERSMSPKGCSRPLHNKSAVYSVFFLAHLYDRRIYRVFHQLLPLFPQNGFTVYSKAHLTK